MTTYRIMFCCNDERGNHTGRVSEIEIGDEMRLAWTGSRPPAMRAVPSGVKIGRRVYECRGWSEWVGNVFWNAASMAEPQARQLIVDLLASGWVVEEHAADGPFARLAS